MRGESARESKRDTGCVRWRSSEIRLTPRYARNNIIVRVRPVRTHTHKYIYSIYNVREQHKYVRRGVIGRDRGGERRREIGEVTQSRMRFEIACAIEGKTSRAEASGSQDPLDRDEVRLFVNRSYFSFFLYT
jgi:hypothetical protein